MQSFINIFWNSGEIRIRTFFRMFGFILLSLIFFPAYRYFVRPYLTELPFGKLISIIVFLALFLLVVWIASRYIDKRNFSGIGFNFNKEWWINFSFGLFLGAFILSFVFLFEAAFGWIEVTEVFYIRESSDFTIEIIAGLLLYISVGIREETISRGYLIKNLAEGINNKKMRPSSVILIVSIITSILFGLGHANNPNATLISTWNLMVIGILLAYAYIATGSLAMPIGIHITWNFFQGCVFGFPVSGHPVSASFLKITQYGNNIWTGGNFGPEGGLVIYLASAVGFLMIFIWQKARNGGAALRIEIAEYHSFVK